MTAYMQYSEWLHTWERVYRLDRLHRWVCVYNCIVYTQCACVCIALCMLGQCLRVSQQWVSGCVTDAGKLQVWDWVSQENRQSVNAHLDAVTTLEVGGCYGNSALSNTTPLFKWHQPSTFYHILIFTFHASMSKQNTLLRMSKLSSPILLDVFIITVITPVCLLYSRKWKPLFAV